MSVVGGHSASGNLESMVALLSDPKALKAKFDQLTEAQRQAQAVLDQVGPAQDILALRDQTQAQLKASQTAEETASAARTKLLADAKTQAALLLENARTQASQIVADAATRAQAAASAEQQAASHTAELEAKRTTLDTDQKMMAAREAALARAQAALAAKERELSDRIGAFHKAHRDFVAAVGAGASGA